MTKPALTPKQEQFCREYLIDLNATQAAIRAGYSAKTAQQQGSRLLLNVVIAARIAELKGDRAERAAAKLEITADRVLEELARIGFSRVTDYMRITSDGEPAIDLSNLTDDQKAAIAEVTVEDFTEGRGEDARDVRRVRFKLHSKPDALRDLGRHLGIFEKDNAQRAPRLEAERMAAIDAEIEEMMHRDTGNGAATRH